MLKASQSLLLAGLAAIGLGACTETSRQEASGKGNLRAINAIISSPEVVFLIEERALGGLGYKGGTSSRFDNLSYNVNFEVALAGDVTRTRIATEAVNVVANNEHVFVLTGDLAAPDVLRVDFPERQWANGATVFEARSFHLAATATELDVYLSAPNTVPVIGERRASLAFGELSTPFDMPAGEYELVLTTKDVPNDIRFRSRPVSQAGGTSLIFSIFDPDPSITSNLSVRVMGAGGASAELADDNIPPTVRLMHASIATGNVDLFADDDFTTPLVANVGYGELTTEFNFGLTAVPLTFTPTGNTGVLLLEDTLTVLPGSRNSMFLIGAAGELDIIAFQDERRPIETFGRFRLVHLADNVAAVDVYIVEPGDDIDDRFPRFFSLPFRATTGYTNLDEGSYQFVITEPGEKVIIGGPLTLDLALGGIAELALLDTPDPNVLNLVIYDN